MFKDVLKAMARMAANDAKKIEDDAKALEVKHLYPKWRAGVAQITGDRVNHEEDLYKCLQDHMTQEGWEPNAAPSLYAKILLPDEVTIYDWQQPDSTNPFMKGDVVSHKGKVWESLVDNNAWEPGAEGTEGCWKVVEE